MNILTQKIENDEDAIRFWDTSVYDMLDITLFLTDNKLFECANQFCGIFADEKKMQFLTQYKFDFSTFKALLGVPQIYVDRQSNLQEIDKVKRNQVVVDKNELEQKYNKAMEILQNEIKTLRTSL